MKTLAVIGGNGMLGSDLVRYLSPDFSVVSISKENYSQFINKSFDVIINANGNSKRFWANNNILEDFALSTHSVYKSILDFKCRTYIYISSSDVYENHSSAKYTQEDNQANYCKITPYGLHKYISELIVKKYVKNYLILRCSMILGENLKKGPIYDIINKNPLFVSKTSRLQMISAKEVANVVNFLVDKRIKSETFNLGGKGIVDFRKIQTYFSIPIRFQDKNETQIYEMNVSKLNSIYPLKTSQEYLRQFISSQA